MFVDHGYFFTNGSYLVSDLIPLGTLLVCMLDCSVHKGCSRHYPRGGEPQAHFCPVGGGCFVDVSEGWGLGANLSWGSRRT